MKPKIAKQFEIHTAKEWICDYGAGFENYVLPKLAPKNVPRSVRHLVPFAAEWGIPDDVTRNHKLDSLKEEQFMRLYYYLRRHSTAMNRFIDRMTRCDPRHWSAEERHFLYLGKCYGELSASAYWNLKKKRKPIKRATDNDGAAPHRV